MTKKSSPELSLVSRLLEHVLITDHLHNLERAHGDVDVSVACSCGAILGRVVAGPKCLCGHERESHRSPALGGCQQAVVQVRTAAEMDEGGKPTGKTVDVVERAICDCPEFRSKPTSVTSRANIIDTWLKHAGLPENPTRDHLLLRLVGEHMPGEGLLPMVAAICLCGANLPGDLEDPTDPAMALSAWARHVAENV